MNQRLLSLCIWILTLGALLFHLYPLFSSQLLSSWDLPVHYYLSTRMLENLQHARLLDYNPYWFGGYEEFSIYGPFCYLVPSLIHILSLGIIELPLAFNLSIVLLVLCLLLSFLKCGESFFGSSVRIWLLVVFFWYLSYPRQFFGHFLGLHGIIKAGVLPNYWALCFFLLGLGGLQQTFERPTERSGWILFSCALPFLLFTHLLTFAVGILILTIFAFCQSGKISRWHLIGPALATIPFLPWIIQLILHLPYTSITPTFSSDRPAHPLLVLFPGLSFTNFASLVQAALGLAREQSLAAALRQLIVEFPFNSLWMLISICFAIIATTHVTTKRQCRLLLLTTAIAMIVLASDFLTQFTSLPFRPYRSIQALALILLLVCAYGLQQIWQRASKKIWSTIVFVSLLAVSTASTWFIQLRPNYLNGNWDAPAVPTYVAQSSNYSDALQLINYLKEQNPSGRIAVEQNESMGIRLGAPRFFLVFLPLLAQLEVLQGVPEEVAGTSDFVYAPTIVRSAQTSWAAGQFSRYPRFIGQPLNDVAWRLGQLGVQYLISSSDIYRNSLLAEADSGIIFEKSFGPFSLFRIAKFCPAIFKPAKKPWLFLEVGGQKFSVFSRLVYAENPFYKLSFIKLRSLTELQQLQPENFAGIIFSARSTTQVPQSGLEGKWKSLKAVNWISSEQDPSNKFTAQLSQALAENVVELANMSLADYCPTAAENPPVTDVQFYNFGFSPSCRSSSQINLNLTNLNFFSSYGSGKKPLPECMKSINTRYFNKLAYNHLF